MAVTLPGCASFVNQSAQHGKKFRYAVDFIDDDELGGLRSQIGFRVFQAAAVRGKFQIQVHRALGPVGRQLTRKRGFSHLTWSEQDRRRHARAEPLLNDGGDLSSYHPRKSYIIYLIYGVNWGCDAVTSCTKAPAGDCIL